jgi:hypothetical protein
MTPVLQQRMSGHRAGAEHRLHNGQPQRSDDTAAIAVTRAAVAVLVTTVQEV